MLTHLTRLIVLSGLRDRVTLTGPLCGESKWSLLAVSSVFVLPSHSEGLSVAVLESLAAGTPVVISKQCNIPEVEANGCGWTAPLTEYGLADAISNVLRMPRHELQLQRRRAVEFVRSNYSWTRVGAMMRELYSWVLEGTAPTAFQII
jgi:glycosyltransferase involved in cell wall biosynthesis